MKLPKLLLAGLAITSVSQAAINIETSYVGDAGNANDSTGFGGLSYNYHIGTYEVTNGQYAAFLNDTASTDTYGLYNTGMTTSFAYGQRNGGINRSGSSGSYNYSVEPGFENKPVNYVSFWDAARFSNWLTSGNTETGVYVLDAIGISNNTITRDETAWANGGVAIASENEWYKAAYYSGSVTGADGDGYWRYSTQSNSISTSEANYLASVGTLTDGGSYAAFSSYYGTFDQAGNLWEWNDQILSATSRVRRGGSFGGGDFMSSSYRFSENSTSETSYLGFRVSSLEPIPEPSAAILGLAGLGFAFSRRVR